MHTASSCKSKLKSLNNGTNENNVIGWSDGCFDATHYGHFRLFERARDICQMLVVGVHSDREIEKQKRPPLVSEHDRYYLVRACRFVDKVVEDAPYDPSPETLDLHGCDFHIHGSDISLNTDGKDACALIKSLGKYREVARTRGISTTWIIKKILEAAGLSTVKAQRTLQLSQLPRFEKQVPVYMSSKPRPEDACVYIEGDFDLLDIDVVKKLEEFKNQSKYVIVGVLSDENVSEKMGSGHPILVLTERCYTISCIKYCDAVIADPTPDCVDNYFKNVETRKMIFTKGVQKLQERVLAEKSLYVEKIKKKEDPEIFENIKSRVEHVKQYAPSTTLDSALEAKSKDPLKLDWNECTVSPPAGMMDKCFEKFKECSVNYYPHLYGSILREKLAEFLSATEDSIVVTNGSDDALKLICDTFLQKGDKCLIPQPSYSHFRVYVEANHAEICPMCPADPYENVLEELMVAIHEKNPNMVYLISPNNPTGAIWSPREVQTLLETFPTTVFILDEAYIEFGGKTSKCLIQQFQNIVITRTFSKAYGLAAFRIGYLLAHEKTVKQLLKVYNPKSVNEFAQIVAAEALAHHGTFYTDYINEIKSVRQHIVSEMLEFGAHVKTGHGNFMCLKVPEGSAQKLVELLKEENIFIRNIDGRFPNHVRITLGTRQQMKRVKLALKNIFTRIF